MITLLLASAHLSSPPPNFPRMTRIRGLRGNLKSRSAGLFDVIARM